MTICFKCHQPITQGSNRAIDDKGRQYHYGIDKPYCGSIGCPMGESIIDNLRIAIDEGFVPEFCRTHESRHKKPIGCSCHHVDFYGADAAKIHKQAVEEAIELRGFW